MTQLLQDTLSGNVVETLRKAYIRVRQNSEDLCAPLAIEDFCIQTMDDVSPTKWHIAHTSWFFENFLLIPYLANYTPYHEQYLHLFNSYYEQAGTFHPRDKRGLLSRPTVEEILEYRSYVDRAMFELLEYDGHQNSRDILLRSEIGIHHEQQHQELMLTDIKHIFANNPLKPVYLNTTELPEGTPSEIKWIEHSGGIVKTGQDYGEHYIFDNETPRHKSYLESFALANRLVTNKEYIEFINDGGYEKPQYWMSEGWKIVNQQNWTAPLYWENIQNTWHYMTLNGLKTVNLHSPVCHVSYFEADAYARWRGLRLPSEQEWEVTANTCPVTGNLRDTGYLQPAPVTDDSNQFYGDCWEWTRSAYSAYPGYYPGSGALGEYNGKFMCGQYVLRGGSCVTPQDHIRSSYRNFFYPADRWQFSGIRLAKDLK